MLLGRYRITHPTIALFDEDGRHVAHTVPEGAIIKVAPRRVLHGLKHGVLLCEAPLLQPFLDTRKAACRPTRLNREVIGRLGQRPEPPE